MFRKPKSKQQDEKFRLNIEDDHEKEVAPTVSLGLKSSSMLSFDQDEGNDVIDFKLKRKANNKFSDKPSRKHKTLTEKLSLSEFVVKKEGPDDDIRIEKIVESRNFHFIAPEQGNSENNRNDNDGEKTHSYFIPDAKVVYEAKKKREFLRRGETEDSNFVPLDDTIRLKSKGQRSRLVREDDENDFSDEDDGGKFYSARALMAEEEEQRREGQAHFLRIEQGGSDEEDVACSDDDELARWEREQIAKGVSSNKVMQLHDELSATSLNCRGPYFNPNMDPGEIDMDIDIEVIAQPSSFTIPNGLKHAETTIDDVLERIGIRIIGKQEQLATTQSNLERVQTNITENITVIRKIDAEMPKRQERYKMFQEISFYIRDLLECLNEKIETINQLEEKIMLMWKSRSERLIERRRKDVEDTYAKCSALSAGKPCTLGEDSIFREAEREARRKRRKHERTSQGNSLHYEGMSSDDEETTSQGIEYKETMASVLELAKSVFIDTADEFFQIDQIIAHFIEWYVIDEKSFEEAYVFLCLPKLISPFIRLKMLDWQPLRNFVSIFSHDWYQKLLIVGLNNSGIDLESSFLVNLIPSVVAKVLLPKLTRIIREQWDPFSLYETKNLSLVLNELVDEYPTVNASSKKAIETLEELYNKIQSSIQKDMFIPVYSKETLEKHKPCREFLDRQFWKTIKLIRSIIYFRGILSDQCLEELVIEGIINRNTNWALRLFEPSDRSIPEKCFAVINEIPSEWLPSAHPRSYESLVAILNAAMEEHNNNRKFISQARLFIEKVRKVKDEDLD